MQEKGIKTWDLGTPRLDQSRFAPQAGISTLPLRSEPTLFHFHLLEMFPHWPVLKMQLLDRKFSIKPLFIGVLDQVFERVVNVLVRHL